MIKQESRWSEIEVATQGFTHNMGVKITLSLDAELVRKLRKIAIDRDTTLTGMVRDYLERIASQEEASNSRRRRERERLEAGFEKLRFRIGKRNWKRQELYARS